MIRLPWPPTVNHYYTVARGRKILSKKGRQYRKDSVAELMEQMSMVPALEGECSVFIRAYPPDRRKRDLDNILKPVLDVMQYSGIFADDYQISDLRIQRFNPSKPGRVEIMVYGEKEN